MDEYINSEALLLINKVNSLNNKNWRGTISSEDFQREINDITNDLVILANGIAGNEGNKLEENRKKEKIERSAASFVEDSIKELRIRETNLRRTALFWYLFGVLSLLVGVILGFVSIFFNNESVLSTDILNLVYLVARNILIIALLVAVSRYSFNLGKTYMNESLKNSDRVHAISFGKFYLQVFGTDVRPDDLKDVFKDWNANNESSFLKLESQEIDPQVLSSILKLMELIKK